MAEENEQDSPKSYDQPGPKQAPDDKQDDSASQVDDGKSTAIVKFDAKKVEAKKPEEPKEKLYIVVASDDVPIYGEYDDEETFLQTLGDLHRKLQGSGAHIYAFRGWRIPTTSIQVSVGVKLSPKGPMRSILLSKAKMNKTGMVPQIIVPDSNDSIDNDLD